MADDNRLPTNQSQLDIAAALNGIASALTPQNTVNADSIYPVETSPSTHAYNEGEHLIVSGVTYVAIDDIAIGDSLVLNTNIQAETLATRMNHIEDGIEAVDSKTASDIPYSSGVSTKAQIDKKAGKLVINTLGKSSFSYDSSAKYFYSNNPITYYYGSRKVFGLQVVPEYLATCATAFINSNNIICVVGVEFPGIVPMSSNSGFSVKIAMEDYS